MTSIYDEKYFFRQVLYKTFAKRQIGSDGHVCRRFLRVLLPHPFSAIHRRLFVSSVTKRKLRADFHEIRGICRLWTR